MVDNGRKCSRLWCSFVSSANRDLQAVGEDLVHLGDAGGDAEVDGAVTDLDDETADNVRVDLVGDLELLAGTNVRGLADGGLELGEGLAVEGLGGKLTLE